jgi:hypothetical protein
MGDGDGFSLSIHSTLGIGTFLWRAQQREKEAEEDLSLIE